MLAAGVGSPSSAMPSWLERAGVRFLRCRRMPSTSCRLQRFCSQGRRASRLGSWPSRRPWMMHSGGPPTEAIYRVILRPLGLTLTAVLSRSSGATRSRRMTSLAWGAPTGMSASVLMVVRTILTSSMRTGSGPCAEMEAMDAGRERLPPRAGRRRSPGFGGPDERTMLTVDPLSVASTTRTSAKDACSAAVMLTRDRDWVRPLKPTSAMRMFRPRTVICAPSNHTPSVPSTVMSTGRSPCPS